MAQLLLPSLDHNSVAVGAPSAEPVALQVRLESDDQLRLVGQLWRDGFVRTGGGVVPEGQHVHATFELSRYLSLTVGAVAGSATVGTFGDTEQTFRFAPDEPDVIDVLMTTALFEEVVH